MADDEALTFVPLMRHDFTRVVGWLAQPHVAEWWHKPQGLEAFEAEYGPCVDGTDPTLVFICTSDATPMAFVQMYRIDDEPAYKEAVGLEQAAGMDLFLVEADRRGLGLGPRVIRATVEKIWATYPDVQRVGASPSVRNERSIRAFEKSGFARRGPVTVPGEVDDELVMVCERPRATAG
jgi:aminoglycoside 6'-N-acetyltransferase